MQQGDDFCNKEVMLGSESGGESARGVQLPYTGKCNIAN